MKVTLTEISPIKRSMEVVVDADTVEQAYAKAFKEALKILPDCDIYEKVTE